mmetsp:Transcript_12633/g.31109  ORF Transcript_12633/g.31109 Transcript_12633/m.31109 type:complete len:206 (-) Transcript_12633:961-1578(-)
MNLDGVSVSGPSVPSSCRILTLRNANSQSSMNSHRCVRPASLLSGIFWMMSSMASTIAFLNRKPPSSRSMVLRNAISVRCFSGNLSASARMASTTTILNSSVMSLMKPVICFMRRSTDAALPVLSSVVMASVAIERFTSVIRFSMSRLHVVTASGCVMATRFSVRTAAKRSVALGDDRNSCSTVTAGVSSRDVTLGSAQMARAAS